MEDNYDTRNQGRVRDNAQLIVAALKKAADAGGGVWAKLYHLGTPGGQGDEAHKQMCFSVKRDVLKAVVEACGYRVHDTAASTDAPTWPAAAPVAEREDGDGV